VALFKSSKPAEPEPPAPTPGPAGSKKAVPTPTRREAEAARRERLNPTLSPKEAKRRAREADQSQRQKAFSALEASAPRQLMRDLVDSRINLGEFAMPILLALLAATLFPGMAGFVDIMLYLSWGYIAAMVLDSWLMWRSYKRLAAERLPHEPLKGMLTYGFNRQLSIRRWRQPPPRVKRGEKF